MPRHGEIVRFGNVTAFVDYSGSRKKRPRCFYCSKESTKLCDGPSDVGKKTCDRPLCDDHSFPGVRPNTDFCEDHKS